MSVAAADMSRQAFILSLLVALAASPALAQDPPRAPHSLVRLPEWWGGTVQNAEMGIEAAAAWSKTVAMPRAGVTQRVWVTRDRSHAFGAVVWAQEAREEKSEILRARLRAREMQVRNRVLTGVLLPEDGPIERWVLAAAGLQSQRLVGSGGGVGGELDASAMLQRDPAIKEYSVPGRSYLVALLDRSAVESGSIKGLDEQRLDELQACGMLAAECAAGVALSQVVEAALSLATTETTLGMASMRVRRDRDREAARKVLERAATGELSLQPEVAVEWGEVATLAGSEDSLLGRLGSSQRTEAERTDLLVSHLREQGLEGEPVLLQTAKGQAILLALPRNPLNESQLRTWFEVLGGGSGQVRVPELVLLRSGELGIPTVAGSEPFARGVSVRIGPSRGWVLLEPSDSLDRRFVGGQIRMRLQPGQRLAQGAAIQRAAALHALEKGMWRECAVGSLTSALEQPALLDHVVWAVEAAGGSWSVDFLPSVDSWLRSAGSRAPFQYHVHEQGAVGAGFTGDLAKAFGAGASAAASTKDVDVTIEVQVDSMPPEKGEDKGTGFVAKKPWVRQSVLARILLRSGANVRELQATETTPKVFGGGDLSPYVSMAGDKALRALAEGIPAACRELLAEPSAVVVEHPSGTFPRDVRDAAAGFGPVEERPVEAEPKSGAKDSPLLPGADSKAPPSPAPKDAEKRIVRTRFMWPGGEVGFRRTLLVRNMAGLPALPPGSMFRPAQPESTKTNPLDR